MCGFVGFVDANGSLEYPLEHLQKATKAIHRRGPDGEGHWSEGPVFLGHRRLAIRDLTDAGSQPMHSHSGKLVIAFNGEIYNDGELRDDLVSHGVSFRSTSDTEVLLEYIERFGIDAALSRARGMFAIALWNRSKKTLILARDRMGEKPLYYGVVNGVFVFASELKVLPAFPGIVTLNQEALGLYLRFGYVPSPMTVYNEFSKLMAGTVMEFTLAKLGSTRNADDEMPAAREYASAAPLVQPAHGWDRAGAADELELRLGRAIAEELVADVPVGALLSGGIDSSLVVALASRCSSQRIKTFTVAFDDPAVNEAPFARAIAGHLGTDHHELSLSKQDVLSVATEMPSVYDEPFADPSGMPTLLISRLVREHVTVCLSGDAGDELFKGYSRYFRGRRVHETIARLPAWARSGLRAAVMASPTALLDAVSYPLRRRGVNSDKLRKGAKLLRSSDMGVIYEGLCEQSGTSELLSAGFGLNPLRLSPKDGESFISYASRSDVRFYLPDDILVKMDRAAMHASLESRVPMLNPLVVDFASQVPERLHVSGDNGKQVLRDVLERHVPKHLFDRPKMGFGVPLKEWLRGPLREQMSAWLTSSKLSKVEALDRLAVARMWAQHQSGERDWSYSLWTVGMLAAWLEQHS